MTLQPVIGLEIHVQLATRTKLFCADTFAFDAPPNTQVCPVCLGLPGVLPVLNAHAVTLGVRAATALGCTVAERSTFARKRYAYPDLPKGYQITQHAAPLARGGEVTYDADGATHVLRLRRLHLEEDAARLLHDRVPERTAIDCNRAGAPLIEIVTEPELPSPAHARAFLIQLRRLLRYLDVSECEMEKGSLRVDANVSLRASHGHATGSSPDAVRTELKNMNSFAHVERALTWELARQRALLQDGGALEPVTITWDAARAAGHIMRTKEDAAAYGYTAEPDVPALVVDPATVSEAAAALPELPRARAERLTAQLGISPATAEVITAERVHADYYEELAARAPDSVAAANWLVSDVFGWLNRNDATIDAFPLTPSALAELLRLAHEGHVSHTAARRVLLPLMLEQQLSAADALARSGSAQVSDAVQLRTWVDDVIAAHPAEVARCCAGEENVLGYLMGRIMERSNGRADPRTASALLRARVGI